MHQGKIAIKKPVEFGSNQFKVIGYTVVYASKGMSEQVPLIHTKTESEEDTGGEISCLAQTTLIITVKSLTQHICVLERPGTIPATLTLGRAWNNENIHRVEVAAIRAEATVLKIEVTTIPGNYV